MKNAMHRRKTVSVALIVTALIAITAGILYPFFQPASGSQKKGHYTDVLVGAGDSAFLNPAPGSYSSTIFNGGYSATIGDGGYIYENFSTPRFLNWAVVYGSFTCSGTIDAAILTSTEFGSFVQNPSAINSGPYYSQTTGTSLNVSVNNGSYTFVFYNPSIVPLTSVTVTIGNAVTLLVSTSSSGYFSSIPFEVPDNVTSAQLAGSYSSNSSIEAAVLTAAEFHNFSRDSSVISSGPFFSGLVSSGNVSVELTPGSYVIVFFNPSVSSSAVVDIDEPLVLEMT